MHEPPGLGAVGEDGGFSEDVGRSSLAYSGNRMLSASAGLWLVREENQMQERGPRPELKDSYSGLFRGQCGAVREFQVK